MRWCCGAGAARDRLAAPKLTLVAALIGYHVWCYRLMSDLHAERNRHSSTWYRVFNEAPACC